MKHIPGQIAKAVIRGETGKIWKDIDNTFCILIRRFAGGLHRSTYIR